MATIDAYIPQPTPPIFETEAGQRLASGCIEYGGWDYKHKSLSPIRLVELLLRPHNHSLSWVMDSLAAAAEAGRLDAARYIEQLFAGKEDVHAFRGVLREASGERWLNERHHNALRKLGNVESDVVSYVCITALFDPAE